MTKIITIGSATLDVYLQSKAFKKIKSNKFPIGIGECLALGSKNNVDNIFVDTGGGATNAAVTFANLGIKTFALIRVGDDLFGKEVINILKARGIGTTLIQVDKKNQTGYSTLLTIHGQRSILVYRGASTKLLFPNKLPKTEWFYLTSVGGDMNLLKKIFNYAKNNNIKVMYNPGGGEIAKGLRTLKSYFKNLMVLNLNREEAAQLCKTKYERMDIMLKKLKNIAPYIIITDGAKGAYAISENKLYFSATLKTKAVNTTGAGDAFGSGLASGLILKNDIEFALKMGTLNADGVIRKMGAKNGLLKKIPSKIWFKRVKIKHEKV